MRFRDRDGRTERELRRLRPEPRRELVDRITGSITPPRRAGGALRVAFAGGLSAGLLVALASVGGISYAASAASQTAKVVKKVFTPSSGQRTIAFRGLSAGGDQYRPGYGFGDPNHNHSGPPRLRRAVAGNNGPGTFAPPLQLQKIKGTKAKRLNFRLAIDEQAHLWIAVLNPKGKPLLLTQRAKKGGTKIGGRAVRGRQTKFIQYLVRVPRSIPMSLRIPGNLLRPGRTYRIRIIARDPDGHKSRLIIPFKA